MRRMLLLAASLFVAGGIAAVAAQQSPAFEVASVKRSTANPGLFHIVRAMPGGRVTATALTLKELMRFAYMPDGIQLIEQIVGGPAWIGSDKFDLVAKADSVTAGDPDEANRQRMAMLKALLADRFKLRVHRDKRELPVFDLVLANKDGKLGPQMKMSTCNRQTVLSNAIGTSPATMPASNGRACQPLRLLSLGGRGAPGVTAGAEGVTIQEMTDVLSGFPEISRPIRDRTGLTGAFDLTINWVGGVQLNGNTGDVIGTNPNADAGPGIISALQQQLGLKLESRRDLVDVIVIDSVEPPADD
jgi:uncharacterized protein (TIGR03435 family)